MSGATNVGIDWEATQGDWGLVLGFTLRGADKDTVNLTGATITAKYGRKGQDPIVERLAVADPDQTTNEGQGTVTWANGDLDEAGEFELWYEVEWVDKFATFPTDKLVIRIKRRNAAPAVTP